MEKINLIAIGGKYPELAKVKLIDNENKIAKDFLLSYRDIYRVAISMNQKRYAVSDKYGRIRVFDFFTNKLTSQFLYLCNQVPMVLSLNFLGDDILIASGTDFQIRIYDLKINKIINIINTQGYVFGLIGINENQIAGISRNQSGDHLYIWDIKKLQNIYVSPSFKAPKLYMYLNIDINPYLGLIVHSDRFGNIHVYNMKENFNHTSFNTGHNEFYAILFLKNFLLTGGIRDTKIKVWNLDNFELENELKCSIPIAKFARIDMNYVTVLFDNGQLSLLEINDMKLLNSIYIPNIFDISYHNITFIENSEQEERIKQGKKLLYQIQKYFESGDTESAYEAIRELEAKGFKREALEALSIAENVQGKILNELETLLILTSEIEINKETLKHFERLAEILELINEPEFATHIYMLLFENTNDIKYNSKIEELKPYCIEKTDTIIAIDGESNPDFVRAEIRKAEILNRYFEQPISFENTILKTLEESITIENFVNNIKELDNSSISEIIVENVIFKIGMDKINAKIVRIKPINDLLQGFEVWVELPEDMFEIQPLIRKMFVPDKNDGTEKWNFNLIIKFNNLFENIVMDKWFNKILEIIQSALIVSTGSSSDFEWN